jgi:hypothetical protein
MAELDAAVGENRACSSGTARSFGPICAEMKNCTRSLIISPRPRTSRSTTPTGNCIQFQAGTLVRNVRKCPETQGF